MLRQLITNIIAAGGGRGDAPGCSALSVGDPRGPDRVGRALAAALTLGGGPPGRPGEAWRPGRGVPAASALGWGGGRAGRQYGSVASGADAAFVHSASTATSLPNRM